MKIIFGLLLLSTAISNVSAAEGMICKGSDCSPVEVTGQSTRGNGLLRLRDDQTSKLEGAKQDPSNKNYLYNSASDKTESAGDIKLHEISVGTCLVNPDNGSTFYKVLELDQASGKVRYVAENDEHNYMLKGNIVFWRSPDSNAFKKLRRFPCNRTPNLHDDAYVNKCANSGAKLGELFCDPKSKL